MSLTLVSFEARSLLKGHIESSEEFTGDDSESYAGLSLIEERFNITRDQVNHIVIIDLNGLHDNEVITSNQWRNFTLSLTLYIQTNMASLGYDIIVSEPLLLAANQTEYASTLVSEDGKYGMISVLSSSLRIGEGTGIEDFSDHLTLLRDLIANMTAFYQFAQYAIYQHNIDGILPTMEKATSIKLVVTGTVANFVDLIEVANSTFDDSEIIAVIVIIIILALVFRSPMGVALPIISMVCALFPTYLATYILASLGVFSINDFLPSLISMIGIAVAVDYNLFSMVRYREEYRKRKAEHELNETWNSQTKMETQIISAKIMNATAGNAVMFSGFTVMTGFGSMLALGSDFTMGMAVGVTIVVALSILTTRTLTPAILSLWGDHLDWPEFLSGARKEIEKHKDKNNSKATFWVKWSNVVMKHAWMFLILGILFLVPFIAIATQVDLGFNMVSNLPRGTEARDGFEIMFEDFDLGALTPFSVVIDTKTNNSVFDATLIEHVNQFAIWAIAYSHKYEKDDTMQEFQTLRTLSAYTPFGSREVQTMTPDQINFILSGMDPVTTMSFVQQTSSYVNYKFGNNTLIIDLTSNLDPGSPAAFELVDVLRDKVKEYFGQLDVKTYVTGFSASFTDSRSSLYNDVPKMLLIAVILIFIALLLIFRSIMLPLKAILTIGGSIMFAIGALVLVFQDGYMSNIDIFGVTLWESEKSGVSFIIPVFLFTTILGLGMDYSIFIITRIREEYEKGKSMEEAVGIGLSKTAGVITSAATIMTATFMVFALSPMVILKSIGFAMAVAIIVDASVSRIIIVPAAMRLLGEWNWWLPKWLKEHLPHIKLEH